MIVEEGQQAAGSREGAYRMLVEGEGPTGC